MISGLCHELQMGSRLKENGVDTHRQGEEKRGGLIGSEWARWKPQRSLGETGEAVEKQLGRSKKERKVK